jgi:hypothetical protein
MPIKILFNRYYQFKIFNKFKLKFPKRVGGEGFGRLLGKILKGNFR